MARYKIIDRSPRFLPGVSVLPGNATVEPVFGNLRGSKREEDHAR